MLYYLSISQARTSEIESLIAGFGRDLKKQYNIQLNELPRRKQRGVFIVDAALFVPQSRQRLFLIGKRGKRKADCISEAPSFYQSQCPPHTLADFILWNPDIRWALRSLPPIVAAKTTLRDILECLPSNSVYWWSKERILVQFKNSSAFS